ncbi:MAG: hypothetical protein NC548_21555 [Lachnospiraceae bacterium]|nr:hypothetical protein [Lachnospiraceae bacterium]
MRKDGGGVLPLFCTDKATLRCINGRLIVPENRYLGADTPIVQENDHAKEMYRAGL